MSLKRFVPRENSIASSGYLWLRLTGFLLIGLVAVHIVSEFVLRGLFREVNHPVINAGILGFVVLSIIHGMLGWQRVSDDLGVPARGRKVLLGLHVLVGLLLILAALVVLQRLGKL